MSYAAELGAPPPVRRGMKSSARRDARSEATSVAIASDRGSQSPWHVRPALVVALVLSLLLHLAWSMWPAETTRDVTPEEPPLTATLREMPPPLPAPPPPVERVASPAAVVPKTRPPAPRRAHAPVIAVQKPSAPGNAEVVATHDASAATASATPTSAASEASLANVVIGPPAADATPPVVLPPRLDLAYKVFFGTQGFMIGEATYRFERDGDRYRISTVAQPRGLAALIVHGKGLVESRGTITPQGLKPYEFVVERGSADKREVAYFDWDAGNVVLNGGDLVPLEAPAFDPLTILWQPYFAPPSRDDQSFSLATTRRVSRYTLSLAGEETIAWRNGDVVTQRWHQVSDDGKTEGWFWLAPSMHYIPVKMRVTRTSRGTLEAVLDAIRTDATGAPVADEPAAAGTMSFKPPDPRTPDPGGAESHGQ
jgi:hypothetical protein